MPSAAIAGEPDQLDPQKTGAVFSFEVLENVFDTLVEPDANLEMRPALAQSRVGAAIAEPLVVHKLAKGKRRREARWANCSTSSGFPRRSPRDTRMSSGEANASGRASLVRWRSNPSC
jgi:hypothetical protein